ncbi:GWxTD domain-containing protein [Melioribacteraceae bacterium 4301-Me]|uniref:GWxTD domain-containing protein n=1 Tax=Pyranulibacter aquaticus TaxID=3163344 RepID=UPI0035970EA7
MLLTGYSNFCAQSKLTDTQIDSLINIGTSELNKKEWGNVLSIFDKVLDADPLNLYANYYFAVAQREKALIADPISRIFRWNSSENHFKNVIKLDSTFKDVFYQYALLQLYKKNYFEALDLVRHQLKIKNNISEVRKGVFYLYDVVFHNEDNDNLEKWLSNPKSDFDMYCLGELYRNTNRLDQAKEIFNSIIAKKNISLTPAYISLVKLYLQEENPQKAAEIYWNAVSSVSDTVEGNFLLNDLVFLFNEKDYSVFKTLKTADDIKQFIKSFWFGRNPYPSMPYNLYLTEYYKRIIYAEKNFWYDGLRLTIYDPNKLDIINYPLWYKLNNRFNDQGIVYLRFGQPNEISNLTSSSTSDVISWLYNETSKTSKMIFHFEKSFNAPANYWKLVPGFTDKFINERLAVWDSRYHDLDPNSNTFSDILKEGVKSIETVLTTDKFNWPEDLKFLDAYYSVSQFKDVSYLSFLVLSFAVPTSELTKEFQKKDSLNFESAITIYDASINPVFHMVKNYRDETALSVNAYDSLFIDKYEVPLKAGLYFVCFDIYLPKQKKVFAVKFKQELKNFENGKFQCSSLETAFDISSIYNSGSRDRKFLKIIPNPSRKFNQKNNVFVYYEIYNLKKDKDRLVHYTINVNIERKESGNFIWNFISGIFSSKKYSLSIKDSFMDTSTNVSNFQAFDMSQLQPGEYVMKLEIKDDTNGEVTSAFSEFILE